MKNRVLDNHQKEDPIVSSSQNNQNNGKKGTLSNDEFLNYYIERSLPPKKLSDRTKNIPFNSKYIHRTYPPKFNKAIEGKNDGINVLFSKFLYNFVNIDPNSGIKLVRITQGIVSEQGIHYNSSNFYLLCYVFNGSGTLQLRDRDIEVKKYDCIFMDKDVFQSIQSHKNNLLDCAFIRIQDSLQSLYLHTLLKSAGVDGFVKLIYGSGSRFRSLLWQILGVKTMNEDKSENIYSRLLMGLLLELEISILASSQQRNDIPSHIRDMQTYIEKNYMNNLTLDVLAKEFNVSKYHMSREFKKFIGQSPIDYLIDVRIQHTKELLLETKKSISEISYETGINSANHLLYLFKKRENTTPTDFRQQFLNR